MLAYLSACFTLGCHLFDSVTTKMYKLGAVCVMPAMKMSAAGRFILNAPPATNSVRKTPHSTQNHSGTT